MRPPKGCNLRLIPCNQRQWLGACDREQAGSLPGTHSPPPPPTHRGARGCEASGSKIHGEPGRDMSCDPSHYLEGTQDGSPAEEGPGVAQGGGGFCVCRCLV